MAQATQTILPNIIKIVITTKAEDKINLAECMSSTFGNKSPVTKDLLTLFWKCSLAKSSDFQKRKSLLCFVCLKWKRTGSIVWNIRRIVCEQDGFHIFHVASVVL